jgi:oxygen-independent coproporphyrinogen-3 oxidase
VLLIDKSPVEEEFALTGEDALREEVFLGLRMAEGLDLERFSRDHGCDLEGAAGEAIAEGLLEVSEGRLRLTERGMLLSNPVIVKLLDVLGLL